MKDIKVKVTLGPKEYRALMVEPISKTQSELIWRLVLLSRGIVEIDSKFHITKITKVEHLTFQLTIRLYKISKDK